MLRGLALVMIFVNHVPGNAYEALTTRNLGFSDAAEGFVLMAGVSAGLAYGPAFRDGFPLRAAGRAWRRAWSIYLVHLLVTAAAFAIAAGIALWGDNPAALWRNGVDTLFRFPLQSLVALPLLLHQLSYANILPLYVVLLLAAPVLLRAAWTAPWALLAGSVTLWAVAGELRINWPAWPEPAQGWQFAPMSWQVLFVPGLLIGVAMVQGRRLVPVRPWLLALCGGFLALSLAWVMVPAVGRPMSHGLWLLREAGVPGMLTSFHKIHETAPRLLHALALAYVLSAIPAVRRICASHRAAPLALLGRQSLPVFALGSVLAFLFQGIKAETGRRLGLDSLMLGSGLLLMLALAWARDRWPTAAA